MNLRSIVSSLGTCSRCLRQSFLAVIVAWLGTAMAAMLSGGWSLALCAAIATSATLLWAAHIGAYALRRARESPTGAEDTGPLDRTTRSSRPARQSATWLTRRRTLARLAQAALVGLTASLPLVSRAWSPCGGSDNQRCFSNCERINDKGHCQPCRSCGDKCGNHSC